MCGNEYIDTIFYFVDTYEEYRIKWEAGHIARRTITFVAENRGIYKDGVMYGRMSDLDLKQIILNIFDQSPYILPIATKYTGGTEDHIGGVMGGKYITVNTANGVISVNAYELFNDPGVQQLVKNIINKEYIREEFDRKASYDQYGIVQVKRNGGILVNGGLISIDPDINNWGKDIKDGLKGADGATPTIGSDGYWYINGKNTGVKAKGEKGEKGDKGDQGPAGSGSGTPTSVKYLVDIQSWYLITNTTENITINTPGWTLNVLTPTEQNRYLWRKDIYKYSDGTQVTKGPYLVGSLGEKGERGEVGPGGGFDPETDQYIKNINEKVIYNYNFIKNLIRGEIDYVDQLVDAIDDEVKQRVTDMITDALWIRENYPEGVIGHTGNDDAWNDDMKAYLQRVGLWWQDENGNTTYRWSDLLLKIGSIEANVNTLIEDPNGTLTTLQAALNLFSDESTAKVTLDTFWAKTNEMQLVIEWMYSGLRNETSEYATFNDLVSAAQGKDGGTAAANLHTGVEKVVNEYGKEHFVAKGHLITELDGELQEKIASGVFTQTDPNYSFASLFSDVQANSRNYNDLHGQVTTLVDMSDPLNAYVQQHMIAEATIYAVEMLTIYVPVNGERLKSIEVPVYYSNPECTQQSEDKEENIYLKYIQDEDEHGNLLWVITEDCAIGGTNYKKGLIVTTNPGQYGEPKRKVKSQNSAGFITYADAEGAYSKMVAEDGTLEAKIEAVVRDGMRSVNINADQINLNGLTFGNGAIWSGEVQSPKFIAGNSNQMNITAGNVRNLTTTGTGAPDISNNTNIISFNEGTESKAFFALEDDGMQLYMKGSDGAWRKFDFTSGVLTIIGSVGSAHANLYSSPTSTSAVSIHRSLGDNKYYTDSTLRQLASGTYYSKSAAVLELDDSGDFWAWTRVTKDGMTYAVPLAANGTNSVIKCELVVISNGVITDSGKFVYVAQMPYEGTLTIDGNTASIQYKSAYSYVTIGTQVQGSDPIAYTGHTQDTISITTPLTESSSMPTPSTTTITFQNFSGEAGVYSE